MKPLTKKKANAVYDILVAECGCREANRDYFVSLESNNPVREYRFCGALGFGGKFWNSNDRLYVNCYNEDLTPKCQAMIDAANKRLEGLK